MWIWALDDPGRPTLRAAQKESREIVVSEDKRTCTPWRAWLFPWISFAYLTLIFGLPTSGALFFFRSCKGLQFWSVAFVPLVWVFGFLIVSGLLSLPHQFSIVPGKFRRDVNDRMYFHRRLYGLCWTTVYYNKPAFHLCLSLPFLKWITFRLFGYRGSMSFTVYPDTWIRDLPLLTFDEGVYLANRATLGSNVVLRDGTIYVDRIVFGKNAVLGHLGVVGPGDHIGEGAEVGVRATLGMKTCIGAHSTVSATAGVEHGVTVGDHVYISAAAAVGNYSRLADGRKVAFGETVPPRSGREKAFDEPERAQTFN